ncbi:MAG: YggS family pyridoxal phosphate-dependent enzyme [Bowdeniella nasicola]|nr:YggS family pyridoxal phosphate-dependent enzyme [Bowdeniella nasicola]
MVTSCFAARYRQVSEQVADFARSYGRAPDDVAILLAVKTQSAEAIREAVRSGARLLGHNRVQELQATGRDLQEAGLTAELHLIGPLQSNKVNHTLRWASAIQTLDRESIVTRVAASLERLGADSAVARLGRESLDVMIQVNTSREASKHGCAPEEALDLAHHVSQYPNLALRGLMTIGPLTDSVKDIRAAYATLARLREEIATSGLPGAERCVELSMGMSADLEPAIAEGATIVRVGRAVFGERPSP